MILVSGVKAEDKIEELMERFENIVIREREHIGSGSRVKFEYSLVTFFIATISFLLISSAL